MSWAAVAKVRPRDARLYCPIDTQVLRWNHSFRLNPLVHQPPESIALWGIGLLRITLSKPSDVILATTVPAVAVEGGAGVWEVGSPTMDTTSWNIVGLSWILPYAYIVYM